MRLCHCQRATRARRCACIGPACWDRPTPSPGSRWPLLHLSLPCQCRCEGVAGFGGARGGFMDPVNLPRGFGRSINPTWRSLCQVPLYLDASVPRYHLSGPRVRVLCFIHYCCKGHRPGDAQAGVAAKRHITMARCPSRPGPVGVGGVTARPWDGIQVPGQVEPVSGARGRACQRRWPRACPQTVASLPTHHPREPPP